VIIKLERALFEVMVLLMWAWIWASGSYTQFHKSSYTTTVRHKTCSQLHCTVQSKQKNGHECRKPSTIDTGDYDVTHAVHTFKTTCNARARNNFKFTFQLMTAGLLNTEEFQNLKYCIRSKGFLEHLEILLYPTVLEISTLGVKLLHTNDVR